MFFNDTEESFYWAGFIAADGCVFDKVSKYGTYKVLQVNLSLKDKLHLEKLAKFLDVKVRVFSSNDHGKIYHKCSIQKQNSLLIESLKRFNIVNNKSFTYQFPEFVKQHHYCNHFIRGYIDGDGGWRLCDKDFQYELNVCGNEGFLIDLKKHFDENVCLRYISPAYHNGQFRLIYCGNISCSKIRDYLYDDANIFLDRKYDIVKNIKVLRRHLPSRNKIIELYTKFGSTKKVGEELGYSQSSISNFIRNYQLSYLYGGKNGQK